MFGSSENAESQAARFQQQVEWIDTRKMGWVRFVWRERVLGHGLWTGLALAWINAVMGGTYGDYSKIRLSVEAGGYIAGAVLLTGLCAIEEWRRRERSHAERYG